MGFKSKLLVYGFLGFALRVEKATALPDTKLLDRLEIWSTDSHQPCAS